MTDGENLERKEQKDFADALRPHQIQFSCVVLYKCSSSIDKYDAVWIVSDSDSWLEYLLECFLVFNPQQLLFKLFSVYHINGKFFWLFSFSAGFLQLHFEDRLVRWLKWVYLSLGEKGALSKFNNRQHAAEISDHHVSKDLRRNVYATFSHLDV